MAKDAAITEVKTASGVDVDIPGDIKKGQPSPPSELSGSEESGYDTEKNPFADPAAAEHWRLVYDKSQYESRHVFDPTLTWTEEEEKKIVRKLDWRICLWAVSRLSPLTESNLAMADKSAVRYVLRPASRPRKSSAGSLG